MERIGSIISIIIAKYCASNTFHSTLLLNPLWDSFFCIGPLLKSKDNIKAFRGLVLRGLYEQWIWAQVVGFWHRVRSGIGNVVPVSGTVLFWWLGFDRNRCDCGDFVSPQPQLVILLRRQNARIGKKIQECLCRAVCFWRRDRLLMAFDASLVSSWRKNAHSEVPLVLCVRDLGPYALARSTRSGCAMQY